MRRLFLLSGLIICSITLFSQLKKETTEQIPILAWFGVARSECTVDRFVELRQSGITHNFTFFSNVEELAVAMESARKAGVKMIIHCPELENEPEKIVTRFKSHPALAGYFIKDEPGQILFSSLGKLVKRIQLVDNKHFCYVNLFSLYSTRKALGTTTYREYVKQFIKRVPVPFLSFDLYPIIKDDAGNRVMRDRWYENLELFSDEARKAGKPFWAFAHTVAHGPYPIPTLSEIRLQVFSNLAYGAQGIQYFTYWTPKPSGNGISNFHNAPIDFVTKKRTEIYDYIQQISREIKDLSPVFLGSTVVSISHTGIKIPRGTSRLTKLPSIITKFKTEGVGAVVSVLKKGNTSYLVIVNRDFQKKMFVTIEGDKQLNRVLKNGTVVKANTNVNRILVDSGDILIFSWKS